MERTTRNWILVAVAAALAVLFVRLGLWQLERHGQAAARAERSRARLEAPPLEVGGGALPAADSALWRRISLRGRLDYSAAVLLRGRGYQGTPGVHLAVPLVRPTGPDVLVVTGWLPAADGIHAPVSRGVPVPAPGELVVRGVALPGAGETGDVRRTPVDGEPRLVVARLAPGSLADSLGRRLAPFYVRRLTDRAFEDPEAPRRVGWGGRPPSAGDDSLPVILSAPELDAGPHMGYAIQWFAFALIAVGGTASYLLTRGRHG